jgi:catechol 2,3-dioxygenase-like lactoylglutathione lyase family enzyme
MRLDHISYRVEDRDKTAQFLIDAFNYRVSDEFKIEFEDGTEAKCYAMEPPERFVAINAFVAYGMFETEEYHSPPEIFVSEGSEGSIVKKWVDDRGGVGGIHHMAYQVDNVEEIMKSTINE